SDVAGALRRGETLAEKDDRGLVRHDSTEESTDAKDLVSANLAAVLRQGQPGLLRPFVSAERIGQADQGGQGLRRLLHQKRYPHTQHDGRTDARRPQAATVDDLGKVEAAGPAEGLPHRLALQDRRLALRPARAVEELDRAGQAIIEDGIFLLDP